MKRSEFKQQHAAQGSPDHAYEAEMAARLAEDAGVQWDPEEVELPKESKEVSLLVERVKALEARDAAIDRVLWATHFKPGEPWHGTKNCHVCRALRDLDDTRLSSGDDL